MKCNPRTGDGSPGVWDNYSSPRVGGEAEVLPREHSTRTSGALINRYGRARETGVAPVAGYAQSLRGA